MEQRAECAPGFRTGFAVRNASSSFRPFLFLFCAACAVRVPLAPHALESASDASSQGDRGRGTARAGRPTGDPGAMAEAQRGDCDLSHRRRLRGRGSGRALY